MLRFGEEEDASSASSPPSSPALQAVGGITAESLGHLLSAQRPHLALRGGDRLGSEFPSSTPAAACRPTGAGSNAAPSILNNLLADPEVDFDIARIAQRIGLAQSRLARADASLPARAEQDRGAARDAGGLGHLSSDVAAWLRGSTPRRSPRWRRTPARACRSCRCSPAGTSCSTAPESALEGGGNGPRPTPPAPADDPRPAAHRPNLRLLEHFTHRLGACPRRSPAPRDCRRRFRPGELPPVAARAARRRRGDRSGGRPEDGPVSSFMRLPVEVEFGDTPTAVGEDEIGAMTLGECARAPPPRPPAPARAPGFPWNTNSRPSPRACSLPALAAARRLELVRRALVDETFRLELDRRLADVGLRLLDNPYAAHVGVALSSNSPNRCSAPGLSTRPATWPDARRGRAAGDPLGADHCGPNGSPGDPARSSTTARPISSVATSRWRMAMPSRHASPGPPDRRLRPTPGRAHQGAQLHARQARLPGLPSSAATGPESEGPLLDLRSTFVMADRIIHGTLGGSSRPTGHAPAGEQTPSELGPARQLEARTGKTASPLQPALHIDPARLAQLAAELAAAPQRPRQFVARTGGLPRRPLHHRLRAEFRLWPRRPHRLRDVRQRGPGPIPDLLSRLQPASPLMPRSPATRPRPARRCGARSSGSTPPLSGECQVSLVTTARWTHRQPPQRRLPPRSTSR